MKFKRLLVIILAICSLSSYSFNKEELIQATMQFNAEMPIPMSVIGTMTSAVADADTIVYTISINQIGAQLFENKSSNGEKPKYILDYIALTAQANAEIANYFEAIAKCNLYLKYIFDNPQTKTRISAILTPDIILEALVTEPDFKSLADYLIISTRNVLPIESSGMKITDYQLEDDAVVATCVVDEDVFSLESMADNINVVKETYLQMLQSNADISASMAAYIIAMAGYKQVLKYIGSSSGIKTSYEITPLDIFKLYE